MQWLTDLELGIQTLLTLQVRLRTNYLSMFNRTTESELTSHSSTSLSCLVTQADLEDNYHVSSLCDDNLSLLPKEPTFHGTIGLAADVEEVNKRITDRVWYAQSIGYEAHRIHNVRKFPEMLHQ